MSLPYFFIHQLTNINESLTLDEDQSKHIIQVLRMQNGEELLLTDGKGIKTHAVIIDDHRKHCTVKIMTITKQEQKQPQVFIAISLIKNTSRFEWFLEKATEIGVAEIIPLICERTEKEKFRLDRMQNILVSAMLQSQQCWLPVLHEPVFFDNLISRETDANKFIAHCLPEEKRQLSSFIHSSSAIARSLMLIGPEGDFTAGEIESALEKKFIPVGLGTTRLRTETAGIVAATLLANQA
jgi:16S rRNA (uracil1498-N3)-methyltransferase